jgi:hypothetical protein
VVEAEPSEVGAEPGFRGGEPEVGGQCESETATDRRALYGRDDRLAGAEQPNGSPVEVAGRVRGARRREVGSGTEVLALCRQHDRAAGRIGVEPLECVGERLDHSEGEEVVRRAAQAHIADVVVAR